LHQGLDVVLPVSEVGPEMDIRWHLPYAPQRDSDTVVGSSVPGRNEGYHLIRGVSKSLYMR